ncbi:hypothetical protein QBC43DRAFT_291602 [Cladorrhinum sp. PSN259]|nr:hypothetical protein QBC43DRAFT_291602 [Cladorrhinum sp. PSN259]
MSSFTYLQDLCAFATERKAQILAKSDPFTTSDQDDEDEDEDKSPIITEVDMTTYLNVLNAVPTFRDKNFPQPIISNSMRSVAFPNDEHQLSIIHAVPFKSLQNSEPGTRKPHPHTSSSPNRNSPQNPATPLLSYTPIPPCSLHTSSSSSSSSPSSSSRPNFCPHPIAFPPLMAPSPSPLQSISTILSANKTSQSWISSIPLSQALPYSSTKGWHAPARWEAESSFTTQNKVDHHRKELYNLVCVGFDIYRISRDFSSTLVEANRDLLEGLRIMLGLVEDTGNWLIEMGKNNTTTTVTVFTPNNLKMANAAAVQECVARLEVIRVAVRGVLKELEGISLYEGYVCLLMEEFKSLARRGRVMDDNNGEGRLWLVCPVSAGVLADVMGEVALGLRRLRGGMVKDVGELLEELGMFTREVTNALERREAVGAVKEWLEVRFKRLREAYGVYKEWDVVFGRIRAEYKVMKA